MITYIPDSGFRLVLLTLVLAFALFQMPHTAAAQDCEPPTLIGSLPTYSAGNSITVRFVPNDSTAVLNEACYFDIADSTERGCLEVSPVSKSLAAGDTLEMRFEGLQNGHTYVFYAKSYCTGWTDTVASVDSLVTTMDSSPPASVDSNSLGTGPVQAIAEPGGIVSLDWLGVSDNVSGIRRYNIYRKSVGGSLVLIDTFPDQGAGNAHVYQDVVGGATGLVELDKVFYQVRPLDQVDNRGDGVVTTSAIPDASAPVKPTLSISSTYNDGGKDWAPGLTLTVNGSAYSPNPAEWADSIIFEVVRDSVEYFATMPDSGQRSFTSGWIYYVGEPTSYTFDLSPTLDTAFVHNHTYYVRCRVRDDVGQLSDWSDTADATMDAKVPDDISNIDVRPGDWAVDSAAMVITWDAASDSGCGVKSYQIYRKHINDTASWGQPIASVDGGTLIYYDDYVDILGRSTYCYRISATDHVNNASSVNNSSWSGCDRPNLRPIIIPGRNCDTFDLASNICYRQHTTAFINWETDPLVWDTVGVDYYVVGWALSSGGGVIDSVNVPAPADSGQVTGLGDSSYRLRVRAVFDDGSSSRWSDDALISVMTEDPDSVEHFTVSNVVIPEWSGDIFLNWDPPNKPGTQRYIIYRQDTSGAWVSLDTTQASPIDSSFYTDVYEVDDFAYARPLTTYEWYHYSVHTVNWLGNERQGGAGVNPIDSAMCIKPPTIDEDAIVEIDSIKITWERPPTLSGTFKTIVEVSKDGEVVHQDTVSQVTEFVYMGESGLGPADAGDYSFRVKEFELDLYTAADTFYTAWSQPVMVPYDNLPEAPVIDLAQPQPIDPAQIGSDVGMIYLTWTHPKPNRLDSFVVTRVSLPGETDPTTFQVAVPGSGVDSTTVFQIIDSGLEVGENIAYRYNVVAWDFFDQVGAADVIDIDYTTPWVYTPQVTQFVPNYFSAEEVTVEWHWLNADLTEAIGEDFGADSVIIELSLFDNFDPNFTHAVRGAAAPGQLEVDLGPTGVNATNNELYFRIRGKDALGNESSFWSTDYFADTVLAYLDIVAPGAVDDLSIDSTKALITAIPDQVEVHLSWSAVVDVGGSGLKQYLIYRTNPDSSDTYVLWDSTTAVSHIDTVQGGEVDNCEYNYRIQAIDFVGNEQDENNSEVCLETLPLPYNLVVEDSTGESGTQIWVVWEIPNVGNPDYFVLQSAIDSVYFDDDRFLEYVIEGDVFTFLSEPQADSIETVFFRVKSRTGQLESGWSELAKWEKSITTDVEESRSRDLPTEFTLGQNYPNPFNPETLIPFSLPERSQVRLEIFNIVGQSVAVLVDKDMAAGNYYAIWTGSDRTGSQVASGIYFYKLTYSGGTQVKKMVIVR